MTKILHLNSNKNKFSSGTLNINKLFENKFAIILVVLLLVVGGLVAFKQLEKIKPQPKTITINKQILQRRSKDTELITRGLTGKAVDVNTGKIVKAARIFSPDDKTVYLELDLAAAPKGTVIDYIRYKEGRYVDHEELAIGKPNIQNVLFNWTISSLFTNVREGKWKVATYCNGILAKRIAYQVGQNKISYVYPDEPVSANDPDYFLNKTLIKATKGE